MNKSSSTDSDTAGRDRSQNAAAREASEVLRIIRSEAVLSRYPIHRLGQKGTTNIEIRKRDAEGQIVFEWVVSPNRRYGEAGPLAYKIDTLVVNRRIDESRSPSIPKLIRLGSLREICREIGLSEGQATREVKRALLQNAFTGITLKLNYVGTDGLPRTFEFADTRYAVIFAGEQLPNGTVADAVCLLLHDNYREFLNHARTRPLDYGYLKALTPGQQRFYELLSFEMYAALNHGRKARLIYSEYCTLAPQVRYYQYKRFNQQMKDLHSRHLRMGYIRDVEYQQTTDAEGQIDWVMLYTPGPRAQAYHEVFTGRALRGSDLVALPAQSLLPTPAGEVPSEGEEVQAERAQASPGQEEAGGPEERPAVDETLVRELIAQGLAEEIATRLAEEKPEECRKQLEYLPYHAVKENRAGFLRRAIETPGGFGPPPGYEEEMRRRQQEEQRRAQQRAQEARQEEILDQLVRMVETLLQEHVQDLGGFSEFFRQQRAKDLKLFKEGSRLYRAMVEAYDSEEKQLELFVTYYATHPCPLPELAEFIREHGPDRLKDLLRERPRRRDSV